MKKIILLLICAVSVFAEDPGTRSFAFLKIPASARLAAMNGASALWEGRDCWRINPAMLAFKQERAASFSQNAWYMSTKQNAAAVNAGHFGLSWQNYSFEDTARDAAGEKLGDFTDRYGVLSMSYGLRLKRYTVTGVTYKQLSQKIYGNDYNHHAWDIGFLTQPSRTTAFGAVVENFGGKKKIINEKEELPRSLQIGALQKMGRLYLVSEVKLTGYEKIQYLLGIEFKRQKNLTLRIGSSYQDDLNLSFGLGWQDGGYFADFAFLPHGALGYAYITSVGIKF
ncbi:MAG: hypothetical protein CVU78_07225 [Elusimicrobia bacterium HGW-Elusimicrobia-2]|nr:MAG: hypothetical protein CVU78_07225 [Elusimicrobia bacterium HGW-Elusimicrobia-2]